MSCRSPFLCGWGRARRASTPSASITCFPASTLTGRSAVKSRVMQAIETSYKGYRFRSRTEARWAVFLDAIHVKWTYEQQGFDLSGTPYLPDFWVESWQAWIEIKGPEPQPVEIEKCRLLSEASGKRVLLIYGEPWIDGDEPHYDMVLFTVPEDHRHMTKGWEFGEGRRNSREVWLVSEDHGAFALNPVPHPGDHKYPLSGSFAHQIVDALSQARAARFEHGESGA